MLKGRAESGGQCLGQQLLVAIEDGDGAVAVQRGSGALALVQQGDDPLGHGGCLIYQQSQKSAGRQLDMCICAEKCRVALQRCGLELLPGLPTRPIAWTEVVQE